MLRHVLRRGGRRGYAAVTAAVSLLVASCGGSHTTDPYAVPSKITPAYVQRVLNALEGVNGRATRLIVENRRLVPEAAEILRSTNTKTQYQLQRRIWSIQISSGLPNYLPTPGPVIDHMSSLISATKSCVFAAIDRDYSKLELDPQPSPLTYVSLTNKPSTTSLSPNPTPWVFSFLGYTLTGQVPKNPCE